MRRVWLNAMLIACGRVDFDPLTAVPPQHVASIVRGSMASTGTDVLVWQASAPGNAILIQPACDSTSTPTVAVTAPGWTFEQITPQSTFNNLHGAVFAAIAPDSAPVQITVSWGVACSFTDEIGDEITGNDPTGGTTTFEANDQQSQLGTCQASLALVHQGSLLWAACASKAQIAAVPVGYTKAADDGSNDWSAYQIAEDPAGTIENPMFQGGGLAYLISFVAVKPR
jgi:hypothetical protein